MKRIKDISKIFLKPDEILMEVRLPAGNILTPDKTNYADHCKVVAVGKNSLLNVGDIVLDFTNPDGQTQFEHNKNMYYIIPWYIVKIAVPEDNFDIDKPKFNLI